MSTVYSVPARVILGKHTYLLDENCILQLYYNWHHLPNWTVILKTTKHAHHIVSLQVAVKVVVGRTWSITQHDNCLPADSPLYFRWQGLANRSICKIWVRKQYYQHRSALYFVWVSYTGKINHPPNGHWSAYSNWEVPRTVLTSAKGLIVWGAVHNCQHLVVQTYTFSDPRSPISLSVL